jgi:hypothetical protein
VHHGSLNQRSGKKKREKEAIENDIQKHEADKEIKEENRRKEEAKMQEKQKEMQQTREKKEWYENNVEKVGELSSFLCDNCHHSY